MGLLYFPAFTPKTSIMLVNIPLNCVSGDILTGCVFDLGTVALLFP